MAQSKTAFVSEGRFSLLNRSNQTVVNARGQTFAVGWWLRFRWRKAMALVPANRNCNVGDSTWPRGCGGGHPACRRAVASPPSAVGCYGGRAARRKKTHALPAALEFFVDRRRGHGFFRAAGRAPSTSGRMPDATARGVRDGAGGRGSSGAGRRRGCRQTEGATSAIQRGRRKRPRWLGHLKVAEKSKRPKYYLPCLDGGRRRSNFNKSFSSRSASFSMSCR